MIENETGHSLELLTFQLADQEYSLGSGLIKLDPQPDRCQFDHR